MIGKPMKVHKVTVLVVDFDRLGADGVKREIENVRYPNDCVGPEVMQIETTEVAWHDEHPLNYSTSKAAAFAELFPAVKS